MQWLIRWSVLIAALAAITLVGAPRAAKAQEAAGEWHGALTVPPGVELRIGLVVRRKAGGGYEGDLLSPDQTPAPIPLDEIKVEDGQLSFSMKAAGFTYAGRWDEGRKAWVGEFRQGAALPLVLTAGKPDPLPTIGGLDGDWAGTLKPNGVSIRMILHIKTDAGGTHVNLDSPDQGAFGIPLRTLKREGQAVSFEINGARFDGTLAADGHAIDGNWAGPAYKGPVTFAFKPTNTAGPKRPQTPKPPFPYDAEEVTVQSAPGVTLAGTLTLPKGKGPFAAVVLITGSGPQDRDETIFGHKPFAVIADRLTRDGVAVLRLDDRGFGKSTGSFATATDDDFAVDTAAAVAYLRTRPDIDAEGIGLIGHSEGGLVAPKVAARDKRIAFVVLMAGPGVKLSEVLRAQRVAMAQTAGANPEQVRKSQALTDHVMAAMRGAKDEGDAKARALAAIKAEGGGLTPAEAESMAIQLSSGWMRGLTDYDPAPTLAKVRAPILVLNGSKDRQVLPGQNLPAIRAATRRNPDVTIVELPGLNHLFQTATTGSVGEYADIEETIAPVALDTISAWVLKHVKR